MLTLGFQVKLSCCGFFSWPPTAAIKLLEALFGHYLEHPEDIGSQSRARIETDGLHRAICDYLSGMTDRYVALEYERLGL